MMTEKQILEEIIKLSEVPGYRDYIKFKYWCALGHNKYRDREEDKYILSGMDRDPFQEAVDLYGFYNVWEVNLEPIEWCRFYRCYGKTHIYIDSSLYDVDRWQSLNKKMDELKIPRPREQDFMDMFEHVQAMPIYE